MATAATLYGFFCPEIVKEYSASAWTRQVGQPFSIYRLAHASRPTVRLLIWILSILGLGYTGWRLFDQFVIMIERVWLG